MIMKPLQQLNNVERAGLLFSLFPEEMPALVGFIDGMAAATLEDKQAFCNSWNNALFSADLWLEWVAQVKKAIDRYGTQLHVKKRLFTDQLFDGYLACFSAYCIEVYFTTIAQKNKRMEHCARMLYEF